MYCSFRQGCWFASRLHDSFYTSGGNYNVSSQVTPRHSADIMDYVKPTILKSYELVLEEEEIQEKKSGRT